MALTNITNRSKFCKRSIITALAILSCGCGIWAQDDDASTGLDRFSYYIPDINLYLRSSLEVPVDSDDRESGIKLNEARFEIQGSVVPDLSYRVRFHLGRTSAQSSLDNSPGSIDIASVTYKFGSEKNFYVEVGKQAAMVGSWEFEKNPTFEYQYSDFVNQQTNIFLLQAKLAYLINERHALFVQVHNTLSDTFETHHDNFGYDANGFEAAKLPLGAYFTWQGSLFNDKIKTFWSYNVSQFAKSEINQQIALGTKLVLPKFETYLDLSYSDYPVDYPGIASQSINSFTGDTVFAQDVDYLTTILRLDYNFTGKWYLTAKGIYERSRIDDEDFKRENLGGLLGVEFKPFGSQDMKFFTYYFFNGQEVNFGNINSSPDQQTFAIGVLYFVNALKSK